MIIADFNLFRSGFRPNKANAKLIIDSNGVLPRSIPSQRLQTIARRNAKVIERFGNLKLKKFAQRNALNLREPRNAL